MHPDSLSAFWIDTQGLWAQGIPAQFLHLMPMEEK
jgi:hypothetical protein